MAGSQLLRLCRPVLAPTAAADVLAGAAFAGGLAADAPGVALAVAGSICLYSAGMVQNDICDRKIDARKAPDRPLVRHPRLVPYARRLLLLYPLGLFLAWTAGAAAPALAVIVFANAYNLGLKHRFPFDTVCLGGARAANLWLGLAAGGAGLEPGTAMLLGGYGLYIAALTAASRAEDLEPAPTRALAVLLSFLPATAAYGLLAAFTAVTGGTRAWILAAPFAVQAVAMGAAVRAATKPAAKRYVFRSLLLIFAVHVSWLWAVRAPAGIIAVLGCAAATFFLRALTSRPGSPSAPSGSGPSRGPDTSS